MKPVTASLWFGSSMRARSSSVISMRTCSHSSASTASTRFLATIQFCVPSLQRTGFGLSMGGFRAPWNAACASPPVRRLPLTLASSPSTTFGRRLLRESSAGPSSSCMKRGMARDRDGRVDITADVRTNRTKSRRKRKVGFSATLKSSQLLPADVVEIVCL
jgi:hypothetical protein